MQWVLLYGDRRVVTFAILFVILAALLVVGTIWGFEMARLVTETRAVQSLFNTLLGGLILFVSVVLSINTAALAQEFTPLEVKLAHVEDSIDFQTELEDIVDVDVTPAGLQPFLEHVSEAIRTETESLQSAEAAPDDEEARENLDAYIEELDASMSLIEAHARTENPPVFSVLFTALEYPYARHINLTRRLRSAHGHALMESQRRSLATLGHVFRILAAGREYFTRLYFKRELRDLSSNLLVLSLPVIVFTAYVLLAIDAGLFPDSTIFGLDRRLLYVNLGFNVALSPYVLLSSYMLRILAVSKYSLESTMFTLDSNVELEFDR